MWVTDLTACKALQELRKTALAYAGEGRRHLVLIGGLGDGLLLAP